MAIPSKRLAESDLDEDEDEDDHTRSSSETPSVSPPSASRKRRRISDDSMPDENRSDREDTPPSEYGSEGDEEDELLATQAIRQKRAEQTKNGPVDCGILESVQLFNFMCHKKYEFKLGPLINFICGANGSGKSAILTAIVLCLGGKASATNRGGSLKSFIKEGEDNARIICRIKNQGEDAFMPEDYGDSIEVERHFNRSGTSGFKIRSASGRVISSKKADLDDICDHFALQIDNPLNVLSQDMARQFISTSNAAEKYRLFIKGVQLEQLDQDYRLIEERLENIRVAIEQKRPDVDDLERSMERAQAKDNAMKKKENIRTKMRDLRRQIAWVQVREQENLLEEYDREVEKADLDINNAEEQVGKLEQAYQACEVADQTAREVWDQARIDLQEVTDRKRDAELDRDNAKKAASEATVEVRNIGVVIKGRDTEIAKAEAGIRAEELRLLEQQGPGPAQRLRDLQAAKQLVKDVEAESAACNTDLQAAKRHASDLKIELETLGQKTDDQRREVKQREDELNDYVKNHNQTDAAYHPRMPQLLLAIEQDRGLRQKPVGPMGKYVRLLKPEWSSILESAIGANLNGFVVTSKSDSNLLKQIMNRVGCHVPILVGNNHPIDTSNQEPDAEFETVLRVMEISNDHVRKQLIIQHLIEQTILISDLHDATDKMGGSGQPKLKNVKRCYCIHPNNKRQGISLSYNRYDTVNHDPVREYSKRPRMRSDNQALLGIRKEAVSSAKSTLHEIETKFYETQGLCVKAEQAVKRCERRQKELVITRQTHESKVEELEESIGLDNVEGNSLDVDRQALKSLQDDKALTEESYKDAINSRDEKKRALSRLQRVLIEVDEALIEQQIGHDRAQQAAAASDKQKTHDLRELNQAIARVDDAKNDRANMNAEREAKQIKIDDFITQASAVSPRVNVPDDDTQATLEARYQVLSADMSRFQRELGGTDVEIAAAAKAARDAFKKGKRDLQNLEDIDTKLTTSLIERRERWKKFRSHISVRAKAMFTYLLSERSFRGKLITDHKQKLLELSVEPDITKRDGKGRNARTLSGGEKSFSQICLLLSIWEAMGSPIRCLDEFDVFMDAVNRRLSVNLLIEGARQSFGRQFVLISPGTKSDIQKADDINGVEVEKPIRGQRTLDESGIQRNVV